MKKIFLAMVAVSIIGASAVAQDNKERNRDARSSRQMERVSPSEMMNRRTQMIVKRYGLNSEQEKKLAELNNKYKDTMRPVRMQDGKREERAKQMEAYNAELKGIMTDEQYKKYSEDRNSRMSQRRGGFRQNNGNNAVRRKNRASGSERRTMTEDNISMQKSAEVAE
ncbi:DUF4890 domain-containing protein [Xylanibacter muris]|uniref:DUF4890 domain-containing protein n=1 Tax=Xylanibacter muris TaxID=2736290 RepID=A0ABX2ART5_9BACT|nr:DUF4890 domain-containing protein [Xylanibacter muris]NPD92952.1 DUF4890 domain-containing protein [Xylanibacter muris]